ncbi:MAG: glycosyltransferase family 2 protein [Sulfurovum sp.]|nr:glycosyltransferase family 2 protein [Sulfurovum sp.]
MHFIVKGVEHLDYSQGNILIKKLDTHLYEFKIIDLNRMKFKKFTKKECLENFAKLWSNDDDLKLIISEYAKLIDMECKEALEIVRKASQKHKDKKNFKKKWFKYFKRIKVSKADIQKRKKLLSHISVVIMAKNASATIAETLDALEYFDEVILYLNDSCDDTKSIAQAYPNVKIIEGDFLGFGATKNKAGEYSTHNWILSLDSDEVLNPTLLYEMTQLDFEDIQRVYALKRMNYFLGRKTQHNNTIIRMYNKTHTSFDNSIVHEKILVPKNTKVVKLKHSFKHLYILNINQTLHKMIHYTDLGSKDKEMCFFIVVIAKSVFAFFKTYILQGNISKGWVGYALAVNSANKRHYKYLKQYINCIEKEKS